jgi:choice-of-anchor A domain-containing protein
MSKIVYVLISVLIMTPSASWATALGVASDYNEFIFGNIRQWNSDSEGRVAAAGKVRYSHMSIGADVKPDPAIGDLVVGGNLRFSEGSVGYLKDNTDPAYQKGSIYVGGTADLYNVGYGSLEYGNPIDFQAAQSYLTQSSVAWGALNPNGTVTKNLLGNGSFEIILTGDDPQLNIFKLSGADVMKANAGSFSINTPPGATVLVNIDGSVSAMQNFGFYFPLPEEEYDWDPYILYNFYEASSLKLGAIEVHGSVLAPFADVRFFNGHIEGQLIASSLKGTGEAHDEFFIGQIPEATTLLLLFAGLTAVALERRKMSIRPH